MKILNIFKSYLYIIISIFLIISISVACEHDKDNILNTLNNTPKSDSIILDTATIFNHVIYHEFICENYNYNISIEGINHIKKYEKCKLTAYWDVNGYSIGWGHHGKDVYKGMIITQDDADELFINDLQWAIDRANVLIKNLPYNYRFSQSFFDGLVSLIYNAGIGNVYKSTFYKRLRNCRVNNGIMNIEDYNFTISAVKTFKCTHKGNKIRRIDEYNLMLN